jgi:hypothetical protein
METQTRHSFADLKEMKARAGRPWASLHVRRGAAGRRRWNGPERAGDRRRGVATSRLVRDLKTQAKVGVETRVAEAAQELRGLFFRQLRQAGMGVGLGEGAEHDEAGHPANGQAEQSGLHCS